MTKYIKSDTATLFQQAKPKERFIDLLWGDTVKLLGQTSDGKQLVSSRGCTGWVREEDLMDTPLLELYFIDVGQGDSVLVITPDRRHIMIDGGYPRTNQNHKKSGADFVDWKFHKDYGAAEITLDAMIASHNDADHYGGLWDLINPDAKDDLDLKKTVVKQFYHAGVSWWRSSTVTRSLGRKEGGFLIDLVGNKASVKKALKPDPRRAGFELQGEWADFMKCVVTSCKAVNRLGHAVEGDIKFMEDFGTDSDVQISVLGPLVYRKGGSPAVRSLGNDSQNTNGNSILLRLNYGRARILLTGDLNKASQQDILKAFAGKRQELAADVMKACHHGSDDCSYEFLECVQASATIISSGDTETHAHPRPNIVAASGLAGFKKLKDDELLTPLVYNTEISRSTRIAFPFSAKVKGADCLLQDIRLSYKETSSGGRQPTTATKSMNNLRVVAGIVYGLVNVRTDGINIMCATKNEGKDKWEIKKFQSRF